MEWITPLRQIGMRLTLTRFEQDGDATIGRLEIDSEFVAYTVEDKVRPPGVKIPGQTAIPAGTYPVQITWSPKFHQDMPLLVGVPGFSGVRIHPGNTIRDSEGCILPGMERSGDTVTRSRQAYAIILREIKEALIAHEDVVIEIIDQFETA